jgi:hypothetical protein
MKRRITFLAAVVAATAASPALANPGKMFLINAVTPGVVSFSGEGTAQFNNSSATANNFTVGSNTNFGVNGSVSSTADYLVDSFANLGLTNNSNLQQSLGTSASAANVSTAAASALETASTSASKQSNAAFGSTFEAYESMVSAIAAAGVGGNPGNGGTNPNFEGFVAAAGLDATAWSEAKGNYEEGIKNEIMSSLVNTSTSSSSTNSSTAQEAAGIIKGSFLTENTSSSKIAATAGEIAEFGNTALEASQTALGGTFAAYQSKFSEFDQNNDLQLAGAELTAAEAAGFEVNNSGEGFTESEYSNALSEKTEKTFQSLTNAAGSGGEAYNKSIADVSVTGVGSIASLNAADSSVFNTNIETRNRSTLFDNNGTANGSAGGSLSTASFANQSNSQSASAFMQAFGADTVDITPNASGGFDTTVNARFDFNGIGIDLNAVAPQ